MIMIIGGYGQVGGRVCKWLLSGKLDKMPDSVIQNTAGMVRSKKDKHVQSVDTESMSKNIIIAGRSVEKAGEFIKRESIDCAARHIDTASISRDDLKDVDTVLMCVESHNENVLNECIKAGVNYIDISPTGSIIKMIEEKRDEITAAGIRVVTGVGIAPGISNLLAAKLYSEFDEVESIDSYLMLGIGESHGDNAIRWSLDNVNDNPPDAISFDKTIKVGIKRQKGECKQLFSRIALADSDIMKIKYPDVQVKSWYGYDVNIVTSMMCLFKKMGFYKSLEDNDLEKREKAYRKLESSMHREMKLAKAFHIGTAEYLTKVVVTGKMNGRHCQKDYFVNGMENSEITSWIAAKTVMALKDFEAGLYHIDDILEFAD